MVRMNELRNFYYTNTHLRVFYRCCESFTKFLKYYTTFKVRKFESLFYKINASLQKTTTCAGLQEEQIFSVNL